MKFKIALFVVSCLSLWSSVQPLVYAAERPNLVVILADDLGYSDLGCYGSEIQTPRLDALAANGLRYTQFYNTARCWPTRGSLMTGYYAQQIHRDALLVKDGVARGNGGKRPAWAPLVAATLQQAGYRTYHSGKWHIDGQPMETGFDRSYQLADDNRYFSPQNHFEDGKPLPPVKAGDDFYMTTQIASHAARCIREHLESGTEKPFFSYVAFTAPHFPLHAKPEDIAKYSGRYAAGWDQMREARYQRQREGLGLQGKLSALESAIGPPYPFPDAIKKLGPGEVNHELSWKELTEQQQKFQAAKMELHAAMVDRIDQEVGRIVDELKQQDQLNNTLLMFLSDNGASAEIMIRGDGHDPAAVPGSADSYLCLGPGWSRCSNTPFRRHKTWVHEGGISTPLIVHWPAAITSSGLRNQVGHVIDIYPTLVDAAGVAQTSVDSEASTQTGPARPGISLLPSFASEANETNRTIWWLHEGNRAIRSGDWKLVAAKGEPWEFYNLANDRAETSKLPAEGDVYLELVTEWEDMHQSMVNSSQGKP